MMRRIGVVLLVVMCARSGALADEGKRKQLREEIERHLYDIAYELRDVPGDSSASDVERTIEYAGKVYDKARELKDHAEADSDARRMADYYPEFARRYQEAARLLKEMKNSQRKLDELPRRCQDTLREQVARVKAYTDAQDPRGVEEVPKLARELGKVGREALELAERTRYEQASWYDRVDDFGESEGKWSDVRSYLYAAGRAILDHVQRQQEQLKRADTCGDLGKEERNPLIEEAMRRLLEGKKGIETLYEALDRQTAELAALLDGLVSDSDDSDVGYAVRKVDEIERLLEQLDRSKGADGEARRRLESWRTISRTAREALAHLRVLKQSQFRVDRAPDKCREASEKLAYVIRGFLDKRDTKGVSEIPLRARGLAEPIKEALGKMEEQHPLMEKAQSETYRFDPSEGRWRDVRDRFRTSTVAIYEYWSKARTAAHAACDELAKGDQHRDVARAVADLSKARTEAETELLRVQADHRKWLEGLRELREWYQRDTRAVRELFCKIPESPGDSAEGDAYAAQLGQIADRMRDRIAPQWRRVGEEALRMIGVAERLLREEDDDARRGAGLLREEVQKAMASAQGILDGELGGANDPQVRARIEFGRNEHKRIQNDRGKCTQDEVTFGSVRVDCIRVSGNVCYVVEIKPNNDEARAKGRKQISDGIEAIETFVRGKKKSDLSGDKSVLRSCLDEERGRIELKEELRVYEYCPADGELFKDFVVP